MTNDLTQSNVMPAWHLQILRVLQDARCGVYDVDLLLRRTMTLDDVDSRLVAEMQHVRDALGAVKVNLSAMDLRAEKVIGELTGDRTPVLKPAAAG